MELVKVPQGAVEDGRIYFCYAHAADSFSGTLDHEHSINDEQIKEFIRYGNPKLYSRLGSLRFSSADIPMSFYAQRRLKKAHEMQEAIDRSQHQNSIPSLHAYEVLEASPQVSITGNSHHVSTMLELQVKRHIQLCLLERHSLILHKQTARQSPVHCLLPSCPRNGLTSGDVFYLTLTQNIFPYDSTNSYTLREQELYCLSCLEDIFDGKQDGAKKATLLCQGAVSSGVDHNVVLETATRLCSSKLSDTNAPENDENGENDDVAAKNHKSLEWVDQFKALDSGEPNTEKDDVEDEDDGEHPEQEESLTNVTKIPSWGVSINQVTRAIPSVAYRSHQGTASINESKQPQDFNPPFGTTAQHTRFTSSLHGFAQAGTQSGSELWSTANLDACRTNISSSNTMATPLFPGSSQTTFGDLGPFITTEGLSTEENYVFDEWKGSLPVSRLVRALMRRGTLDEAFTADEVVSDAETWSTARLSKLLNCMWTWTESNTQEGVPSLR